MSLTLNLSVAVTVIAYDATLVPLPGARLDVQRECVAAFPALAAYQVEPAVPVHDPGPNGVRLYAASWAELQAAAPPSGSPWDVFIDAAPDSDA